MLLRQMVSVTGAVPLAVSSAVPQIRRWYCGQCRGQPGIRPDLRGRHSAERRPHVFCAYCAVIAPSATSTVPVTNDDSSEARKSAQCAISRGSPGRPIG